MDQTNTLLSFEDFRIYFLLMIYWFSRFPAMEVMNIAIRRPGTPHIHVRTVPRLMLRPTVMAFNLKLVAVSPWLFRNPKTEREPSPTAKNWRSDKERNPGASS